MSFSRAVVTGGAGFIGSHIVEALASRGVDVLILDNLVTGTIDNVALNQQEHAERVSFVEADICSREAVTAIVEFKPQVLFHLAAQINVRKSVDDPQFDAMANVVGTINILEAAVQAGAEKFIFTSTGGAIYGEQDYFPADEQHPIRPKCPYGVSKRAAEQYLAYYGQNSGLQTIALRLSNVYGPRQNPKGEAGVVAIFTDRLLRGEQLTVNGDGQQTRDFVYVGDVVDAALRSAESSSDEGFRIYNVGRGQELTVNDVVDGLRSAWAEAAQPDSPEMAVVNGPALKGEQMRSVIAPTKIEAELGWRAATDFSEGLTQTVKSFLDT